MHPIIPGAGNSTVGVFMPDDKRIDLSGELDKVSEGLLTDIKTAASQVKQQCDQEQDARAKAAEKAKSRKLSVILAAIGTTLVLLLSYWIVFARPDAGTSGTNANGTASSQSGARCVRIKNPATEHVHGSATQPAPGRDSQAVEYPPPEEYEQPSSDSGM